MLTSVEQTWLHASDTWMSKDNWIRAAAETLLIPLKVAQFSMRLKISPIPQQSL